jgi:plasmid stabilization system protein ParE
VSRTIEYGAPARRDLLGILNYYDERSDTAGDLFIADLNTCADSLLMFPHAGREVPRRVSGRRKVRCCRLSSRFRKYLVFYAIRRQSILIVRIVHGSRDIDIALGPH